MAITKIWPVKDNLSRVYRYISNEDKTTEDISDGLNEVLTYTTQGYKTNEKEYITGIHCAPATAVRHMIHTRKSYGKDDGVLAFHAVQSFKPDEITPDECHEIGVRLADQMWGDRFEVVVSTHLDRHHLHNHFVINSVSFMDGKKFDNNRKDYMQFRNLSDELCTVSWWLSCQSQKRNRPITKCRIKKYWHKKSFCFENHLYSCGKLQEIISCGFSLCFT